LELFKGEGVGEGEVEGSTGRIGAEKAFWNGPGVVR